MFNALRETTDCSLVDIAQEGFRRTGEVLAPFVALLWPTRQQEAATVEDDEFPPDLMVGDVPAWAYDLYSTVIGSISDRIWSLSPSLNNGPDIAHD